MRVRCTTYIVLCWGGDVELPFILYGKGYKTEERAKKAIERDKNDCVCGCYPIPEYKIIQVLAEE